MLEENEVTDAILIECWSWLLHALVAYSVVGVISVEPTLGRNAPSFSMPEPESVTVGRGSENGILKTTNRFETH